MDLEFPKWELLLFRSRTKVCQTFLFKIVIFSTDNVDQAS